MYSLVSVLEIWKKNIDNSLTMAKLIKLSQGYTTQFKFFCICTSELQIKPKVMFDMNST